MANHLIIFPVGTSEQLSDDLVHPSILSRLVGCKCSTCHSLAELLRRASNLVDELQDLVEIARLSSVSQQHYLQEALADYGRVLENFVEHTLTCGGCVRQRKNDQESSCTPIQHRRGADRAIGDAKEFRPTG